MFEVKDIYKSYKNKSILNGVSFSADYGHCIGILGGNGCGKTTLLSILAGVLSPDSGKIIIDDKVVSKFKILTNDKIAFVPQEEAIIPELSALDNYKLWFMGGREALKQDLLSGIGHSLGIHEFSSTKASRLSGGQKKRLSIASSLSDRSSILIMDEPGAALDIQAKQDILNYIQLFIKNGGLVILTSHEMTELNICDQLYVLKNGILFPIEVGLDANSIIKKYLI